MKPQWPLIWAALLLLSACNSQPNRSISPAFYHWKSTFAPSKAEVDYLNSLGVTRLYTRFFDVDKDPDSGKPIPIASLPSPLQFPPTLATSNIELIPTIYITNATLKGIDDAGVDSLAHKIARKISTLWPAASPYTELQIDCDWSQSTRYAFFRLLRQIRLLLPSPNTTLSATIRLHQVKFFEKTGVPPVDRGMLMFYNMGKLEDPSTQNSILDLEIARQYLFNFDKYPLKLDLALPLFSWGVVSRYGRPFRLINDLWQEDLQDSLLYQRQDPQSDPNHFRIRKSHYLKGRYINKGDAVRLESVPLETLKKAAEMLTEVLPGGDMTLSFYHLSPQITQHYAPQDLQTLLNILE